MTLAEVAVFAPVAGTFTYIVPFGLHLAIGARVWVRFGGRSLEGVVMELREGDVDGRKIRVLDGVVDGPAPTAELVALGRWVSEYYLAPLGETLRLTLPSGGRAREARSVLLTASGERAAKGVGAALEPADLDGLGLRERVVLERLLALGGEAKMADLEVDGARAAIHALEALGLVAQAAAVTARQERRELIVTLARDPAGDDPALARAPKRRALIERLKSGEARLTALRESDPRALENVRALVAAGLVTTREEVVSADPFAGVTPPRTVALALNPGQSAALARIAPAVAERRYAPFLLHGVTGSGKTEIYLQVIALALARGLGALALVPEISLTPQLAERFRARFGDEVAVLHSGLTTRERFDAWARLAAGRVRIALGARSAVFAPVRDLGVVIIDEEHDGSFKQEEGVRYHGRDVAMRRAREASAVAILGSATPSIESYEAARSGRIALVELPERATPRPLPTVEIVDLRQHVPGEDGLLSAPLLAAIATTLAAREQVILFLNRRGFATFVLCKACGHRFKCRDCSVTLTYHQQEDRLACHYCGYLEKLPQTCPRCHARSVARLGLGTERVETILKERFPAARIARLDRDVAQARGGMQRVLDGLRSGDLDLVVGTQMIAKGHDFPGVTLVGVVLADQGLGMPDFRAAERTFQLLAQVAGRAGRGERPGRVLIQTWEPGEPAVARAARHDYLGFFHEERPTRSEVSFPPFVRLGLIRVDGADPAAVRRVVGVVAERARAIAAQAPPEARIALLGPIESPLARLRGRVRWQIMVKAASPRGLRAVLSAVGEGERGVRVSVDVDPVSML